VHTWRLGDVSPSRKKETLRAFTSSGKLWLARLPRAVKPETSIYVRFGGFELDVRSGELRFQDGAVLLQEQSFRLLLALIERRGALVTREELQQQLWPHGTLVEFDLGIKAAIKRLRRVLGDSPDNPKYIETVGRRGYRLLAPVESTSTEGEGGDRAAEGQVDRNLIWKNGGLVGQEVSHYCILEILGEGGMGIIYKAQDLRLGRLAALKFLPEEFSADARALSALEQEACLASSLNHPNICSIYELGTHDGQPFIAMELLSGQNLRDWLVAFHEMAVPIDKLLDIAVQVCDGLSAAHRKGIIHRDIKPANLFLSSSGMVKILDFGLVKLVQGDESGEEEGKKNVTSPNDLSALSAMKLSRTGIAIGTAAYMSPEHIRGEPLDARTDLFSLGVVLYQMSTGTSPFYGDTPSSLFDAILHQTPVGPSSLNPGLPAWMEQVINCALQKDRNLRYQSAEEMAGELRRLVSPPTPIASIETENQTAAQGPRSFRSGTAALAVMLAVAVVGGGFYWRSHARKPPVLTDKDTIVLADFDNKTGDPVFDDTLKQGLAIQLKQSPFLEMISQSKVGQTLKLMGRPATDRLTPEITREVCQRTGSKAMLTGSITSLGSQFVIGLKAVNCESGDVLMEVQEQASRKEAVLKALDAAAIAVRSKLGESLSSVQKYTTPLGEATTSSLEALRAFSLGHKIELAKGETASLPFYERAVELDPNFAIAYATLAAGYQDLNEVALSAENARKAYALRKQVSERERLEIESFYYWFATGELEKAAQVFELWQQIYPRDGTPVVNLGLVYSSLGNWKNALAQAQAVIPMAKDNPSPIGFSNLGSAYANLNRLDEAEAAYKLAEERKGEDQTLLQNRYLLAFLEGDAEQRARLASAAIGKPGAEDLLLSAQADTEGWYGRLNNASELTRRAMDSARQNDAKETAATYQAAAALREVESGYRNRAGDDADASLKLASNRDVQALAALALARAGDTSRAEKIAAKLDKAFPLDTLVQKYWLPTIRAALALERKDPNRAIELLKVAEPIELGTPTNLAIVLCPVYLRGEAYLMLGDGKAAAIEFQKFVDHYGLVANFPWGALARLSLARAYSLEARTNPAAREKARVAYENFLTLWKDADPDTPVYKQAKAEYAKMSGS
jgi:eukaryotic-like serine/threonine-protein kinase